MKITPDKIIPDLPYDINDMINNIDKVDKIINDTPLNIWSRTKDQSGIGFDYFSDYFKDKDQGYAMKIDKLNLYEKAVSKDSLSDFTAPQSFKYVDDDFIEESLDNILK